MTARHRNGGKFRKAPCDVTAVRNNSSALHGSGSYAVSLKPDSSNLPRDRPRPSIRSLQSILLFFLRDWFHTYVLSLPRDFKFPFRVGAEAREVPFRREPSFHAGLAAREDTHLR